MKKIFIATAAALTLASCGGRHFIPDRAARRQVEADFAAKRKALPSGDLWAVFDRDLDAREREALEFLYAYMPLSDMADYDGDFWLQNVRSALQTRREMPWGAQVPPALFRHFVLPVRVNNENLDSSRQVFYAELKDRLKNLSIDRAVLEVNHWCHEKVSYAPSDARTCSPLATVGAATGRCGEESTFTVAALRAVGIPARQVYTPRWAHTDDNHAWVEAWTGDGWHFLGACEPEPALDLAWFNAPASRGMLMHTKVFGRYVGPEEIMLRTANYTEINVIENYAPASRVEITVVDEHGAPAAGARVEYRLYNYAEFYPVAVKQADGAGRSSLTAGRGDMLVWASDGDRFGYRKVSFGRDTAAVVTLDRQPRGTYTADFDMVPPKESATAPQVSAAQRAENDRHLAAEDSIRSAYIGTFLSQRQAREFASRNGYDPRRLAPLLTAARGNHRQLCDFLSGVRSDSMRTAALTLLETLREKDLRDVSAPVLADHLYNTPSGSGERYVQWVLCPRIENEMLTPYKGFLHDAFPAGDVERFRRRPDELARWCRDSIRLLDTLNSQRVPISPQGVWKMRAADVRSRDIFFVAAARSMGIPARIDPVTGKLQYIDPEGRILDVDFDSTSPAVAPAGTLRATYVSDGILSDPKYYSHFTLSKFDGGSFRLLAYDEGDAHTPPASWRTLLRDGVRLEAGYYMLTTGTRTAAGEALASAAFFTIKPGRTTTVPLRMRRDSTQVQVIGSFDSEAKYLPVGADAPRSVLGQCGRGYFLVGVLGSGDEPTNHALRNLAVARDRLEEWGRGIVLLFPSQQDYERYRPDDFPPLPSTVSYGIDADGSVRRAIAAGMELDGEGRLPLFVAGDTFNRTVFFSQGYNTALGEQLVKVINGL